MPVFRFGEAGYPLGGDPDLPLAHGLGVRLRLLVATHPVQIVRIEATSHAPSPLGRGALTPEHAGHAGRCWCFIDAAARPLALGEEAQCLLSGTAVGISRCVIDEILLLELARSMPHLRQWHVGPNALVLYGRDIRD